VQAAVAGKTFPKARVLFRLPEKLIGLHTPHMGIYQAGGRRDAPVNYVAWSTIASRHLVPKSRYHGIDEKTVHTASYSRGVDTSQA
jgi:hypothetical protein